MDEDLKKALFGLVSVATGFVLSQVASYFSSRRITTRQGKGFDFEISALKPALKKQVESMKEFYNEIREFKETSPAISVFKNVDFKQFDRHRVVSYYSRKKKNQDALKLLNLRLHRIAIIEFEIERFLKYYDAYSNKLDTLLNSYKILANQFKRNLAEYQLQKINQKNPDKYIEGVLVKTVEILNAGTITNVIPFKNTLHKELFKLDFDNSTHPMHGEILKFNQGGEDIINDILSVTHSFLISVSTLKKTLETCYTDLYNEKI